MTFEEANTLLTAARAGAAALREEQQHNLMYRLEQEGIYYHDLSRPLYKYMSYERAKQVLSDNSLYYCSANNFNDPFELNDILLDVDYAAAWEAAKTAKMRDITFNSEAQRQAFARSWDEAAPESIGQMAQFFENSRNRLGIFCASRRYDSTLMWSHYGNKHKGVCLGFNVKPGENNTTYTYLSVAYKENLTPVPFSFLNPSQHLFSLVYWMNVKSKVWEYEQETRVINFARNGVIPLDNMDIREIYFGVGLPEAQIQDLKDIIASRGYEIVKGGKMRINRDTFDLAVS